MAGGTAGVGLAIVSPSVIGVLSFFYTVLTVSLFVPVVAGLYVRRVGTPEVAAAVGVGITALLAVQTATSGQGWGGFTPVLLGLLAAVAACSIVGLWRRGSEAPR